MRKFTLFGLLPLGLLIFSLTACKDTKTLQENQQLKAQVAELQKENGDLGNQVETLTAARDQLTKENVALQDQAKAARKRPPAKSATRKRRKSRKAQQS